MQRDLAAAFVGRLRAGATVPPDLDQLLAARVGPACAPPIDPETLTIALADRVADADDVGAAVRAAHVEDLGVALAALAGDHVAIARIKVLAQDELDRLATHYVSPEHDRDAVEARFWSAALSRSHLERYDASVPLRQHLVVGGVGALIRAGWTRAARPAVAPWWASFDLDLAFVPEPYRDRFAVALKDAIFSLASSDATFLNMHLRSDVECTAEMMDELELRRRLVLGQHDVSVPLPTERVARARRQLVSQLAAALRQHVPAAPLAAIVEALPARIDDLFLGFFRVRPPT